MNAQNIADYLASPTHCVNCGSNQVVAGVPIALTESAIQVENGCQDCGTTWTDNFQLAAVSNVAVPAKEQSYEAFIVTYAAGVTSPRGYPMVAGGGLVAPGEDVRAGIMEAIRLAPWQAVERFTVTAASEDDAKREFREFLEDKTRRLMVERGMDPQDLLTVGDPTTDPFEDVMELLRRIGMASGGVVDRSEDAA